MEQLNYTLIVVSVKGIKQIGSVCFDSRKEAERYAEGLTVGATLAGKNYGVIMLLNSEEHINTIISKQMDYRKMQVYFREYKWRKEAI